MTSPIIEIEALSVATGHCRLLHNVSLRIYPGQITLLIGASGAGKTVFLKILAGVITRQTPGFAISGSIKIYGNDILQWSAWKIPPVGIVFQEYGLFDTCSIKQNLDFAFAHSPFKIPRRQRENMRQRLYQKLELDPGLAIRYASGGQKRRIAIARTLAYNPEIIIYDEPTSGLDPHMSKTVAGLIRTTHEYFAKQSSIIVTHQYEEFLSLADNILFLNAVARNIIALAPSQVNDAMRRTSIQTSVSVDHKSRLERCGLFFAATTHWFGQTILGLALSFWRLLPSWYSPRWGCRFLWHYWCQVSFISAIVYMAMSGAIIGFVTAYFTFKFLPYGHYTRPLITDDVLAAMGFGLYRIVVPVLVAVLAAARCTATVASDIGNKTYLQEVDAMKSLGASPGAYLHTAGIYAFMLGMPLLTGISFWAARATCLWVFLFMHPKYNVIVADTIFHSFLRSGNSYWFIGTNWVFYKQLTCGFGLGNICYFVGIRPKNYARDISRDITLAIILGSVLVLLTHLAFALAEF